MSLETAAAEATPATNSPEQTSAADLPSLFLAEIQAESAPPKAKADEPQSKPAEPKDAAPEEAAATSEAEESSEAPAADETAPAEPDDAAETPSEDPAIAAPSGMSEADRKAFSALSPEMKAWVSKQAASANAEFTRKTTAIAEQKKQFDAGIQAVGQRLQTLDSYLAKFTDNDLAPPNPALRQTDPLAYDEQLANYMHAQHQKDVATKERQRVQAERSRIETQQWNDYVREQDQILREKAPELYSDKGATLKKQILDYGVSQGYAAEQLHRASAADIVTLWKAQKYDAIEAAKKQVKTVPPPPPTVARPGPAKAPGRPTALTSALKTLEEKPSRDNLAAAYLAEIRSEKR